MILSTRARDRRTGAHDATPPRFSRRCCVTQHSDVIALEQNTADRRTSIARHFLGVFEHEVHVLVKADNLAFNFQLGVFDQPHLNTRFLLQIPKDQMDRLRHDTLHFGHLESTQL
eukprot:TRINITY_DN83_c0_g1_i1.p1 TRINITY_DN83_c0_g1~~TRINITY_DN83_c0_g1_i1.p1  ORF type:complete len:115 (+),score=12.59 TRINITY_DN83_c0_g1_i1:35-379(+)